MHADNIEAKDGERTEQIGLADSEEVQQAGLLLAKKRKFELDPPQFRGFVGSYEQGPSGAAAYTLLAFLTNYSPIDADRSALIYQLFRSKAIELRDQGFTQRVGNSVYVPDCVNNVLCVGCIVPEAGARWFCGIINVPNTGGGGPKGSILNTWRSRQIVDSGWNTIPITVMGEVLVNLRYSDDDADGIRYGWVAG